MLQGRIVIAVEVVETDDLAAFGKHLPRNVKADKARRTRDQNCAIHHYLPEDNCEEQLASESLLATRPSKSQ